MRLTGHVTHMGKQEIHTYLRSHARLMHGWKDNIKTDLKETQCIDMDGLVVQDGVQWQAFINILMSLQFHNREFLNQLYNHHLLMEDTMP
jgi:hypothetical protein